MRSGASRPWPPDCIGFGKNTLTGPAMKSGDKAFVHLAGVVYVGIVKRAFLSGLGIPSVWIEWPKDINPRPSRTIFYERDLAPPTDDQKT
jgi:hypothetical protein